MKNYPPQFKADAVALYQSRPEATIRQVAADLGINPETLRNWVRAAGASRPRGRRAEVQTEPPTPLEAENAALRKKVRDLEEEREGDLTGPNPVDRGKKGSKIHLVTERSGLPLSIGISGANLHDSQAMEPLVRGIPPIRSHRGPRRRRPAKLHADKGYDYDHLRRWLRSWGITHRIARKGIETSQRLGRHRWTIERTMAWLAGCRRLHRRYERKAEHFLAFTSIACTLICFRRLTK